LFILGLLVMPGPWSSGHASPVVADEPQDRAAPLVAAELEKMAEMTTEQSFSYLRT
jgi:hypothetical protein